MTETSRHHWIFFWDFDDLDPQMNGRVRFSCFQLDIMGVSKPIVPL